jgi:hypothetical protein
VGNRDAGQGHQERRSLVTRAATPSVGLCNPRGRRTSCTAKVLLCSAVAALAIPTAVRSAEALPAVESEPASPGLGHRGLLGLSRTGSMRTTVGPMGKSTLLLLLASPDRRVRISYSSGR